MMDQRKKDAEGASGKSSIEEITKHLERHRGEIHMVVHELVSKHVHIDILWVKPSHKRPLFPIL
jgi:hypothetical protein